MEKEYRFCYNGTKEMFINHCRYGSPDKKANNYPKENFQIEGYIISTIDNQVKFGIERAGHCAGYWFIPAICESNDGIELVGTIQYIGEEAHRDSRVKRREKTVAVVATVILFPIICISKFVDFVKKRNNKPTEEPKSKTKEEKLFDLMIHHFGCTEI